VTKPASETGGPLLIGDLHKALYRWALERGRLDPAKAAIRLGVPMAAIDAAVADLTRLHLLRDTEDEEAGAGGDDPDSSDELRTPSYTPCSPDAAAAHLTGPIEAAIRERHREAERLKNHVMTLKSVFEESWKGRSTQNGIEYLNLPDTVRSVLEQLSASVGVEAAAAHPQLASPAALEEGVERTERVISRGVTMRTLYPHSVLAHQYMQLHLSKMAAMGAQIRTTDHIADRVLFFDREVAVIPNGESSPGNGAIAIREPALVAHLYRAWESSWDSGLPFQAPPSGTGYGPAKDELRRSIARLLESGMKDELAARRLSLSTSTYRRHVADLMNDLGAKSRFQAGSYARKNGWLDS
jgi:DNA-binding CsgD family transcriptional regulator